jgi:hypothetical protein
MVWSNDLAKLKQSLRAGEGKAAPAPPAKVKQPPPQARRSLEEEDAVFLAAMGKTGAASGVQSKAPDAPQGPGEAGAASGVRAPDAPQGPKEAGAPISAGGGFGEAMQGLGGVRPLYPRGAEGARGARDSKEPPPPRPRPAAPGAWRKEPPKDAPREMQSQGAGPDVGQSAAQDAGVFHLLPERIQLAAGMTIEVDCALDLRKHNEADAGERLKERVMDGVCLGWRTMQVVLGSSEPLRQALLTYMASPAAHPLANYGEAPVPMGGAQAWILYFSQAPTQDLDK